MQRIIISLMFAVAFAVPAVAQDASAMTVAYHSQDIVPRDDGSSMALTVLPRSL